MVSIRDAEAHLLGIVESLAENVPDDFGESFWTDIVSPLVSLMTRLQGVLPLDDNILLLGIAIQAKRASLAKQETRNDAAANFAPSVPGGANG